MLFYLLRRILATIPVVAVVALVVFSLLYITPGDPAVVIAGDQATPEEIERIRIAIGLDKPFIVRFGGWFLQVLSGDLGTSIFTNQPVAYIIGQRLGPTFSLLTLSLLISILIAVPLGTIAAWQRGKAADRVFMLVTVSAFSIPVFVVGYLLAYSFATSLRWLPVQGYVPLSDGLGPYLQRLLLPAITLGFAYSALIARVTRASMLDVLSQDYIRTAKAKGAPLIRILSRHALKNAAIPIVTIVGLGLANLIGGSVITENVFAIPGLGRLTLDAILHRDYPVIQGVVLIFSAAYILVNLLVDIIYNWLDPRIRY
jgi:peptide/nickel transport system permease protein